MLFMDIHTSKSMRVSKSIWSRYHIKLTTNRLQGQSTAGWSISTRCLFIGIWKELPVNSYGFCVCTARNNAWRYPHNHFDMRTAYGNILDKLFYKAFTFNSIPTVNIRSVFAQNLEKIFLVKPHWRNIVVYFWQTLFALLVLHIYTGDFILKVIGDKAVRDSFYNILLLYFKARKLILKLFDFTGIGRPQ